VRRARSVAVMVLVVAIGACSSPGSGAAPSGPPDADLTIYAAASLRDALAAAVSAYARAHPGTAFTVSTDSSAALETKIEQGAPADLFLSADTANPQRLVDRGLAGGPVVPFARNALTLIVPHGNPADVTSPVDLARAGVKVIAAGDSVPITKYANELVGNLAALPGYPSGFATAYAANVVSREDNVAAVVAKIELGEGDVAIAYQTDAQTAVRVDTVAVPDSANVVATYGAVIVAASGAAAAARSFLDWLTGPEGRAVLASFGFLVPG
jgi:molybdate transport system substrate-binding protein